jgi:hypothetical protein
MVGLYSGLQAEWIRHVIACNNKGLKKSNDNTRKLRQLAYVRSQGRRSSRLLRQGVQQEQQHN